MRLLYDATLPQSLAHEASAEVEFQRWQGEAASDAEFVRVAGEKECRGVILMGRHSLQQPDLRETATEAGVALVAVEADNPIKAKERILKNLSALRRELENHDCLLVLANEVRPI